MAKSRRLRIQCVNHVFPLTLTNELGIAMQSYYGGRSETRIRCAEVPVVPVDFTSEYPTGCALLGLFDVLTAESVTFEDDTENIRRLIDSSSLESCFKPATWEHLKFFALVQPDNDILPVRTVYDGVTQNIGNNYLTSETPLWFAGCDLIASLIRTGKVPHIVKAIRMVPHGKQVEMKSVNLRGSMVEINPYKDDLFRKVIEQRKLHKAVEALYYWLKILANSIYGFFVELIPEMQNKNVPVNVFSGERPFTDSSDVIENPGPWFFPPLASLITSAGRLLLAMTEACVKEKRGTYLFCDTDSLAIVSSKDGGPLHIPGSEGVRILSWEDVRTIVDRFAPLNPYDPDAVKGSILNRVDANYWAAWRDLPITFPKTDLHRLPDHWRRFDTRKSPLSGSPRLAANPANAILNYLYAVLESETRLAVAALGLDPGLGFFHADTPARDSLACDVMEPVRPQVDAFLLDWITREPLKRSWFFEQRDGNCRLMGTFAVQLSETAMTWARAVAPFAERVARTLWSPNLNRGKQSCPATRLTQRHKREAKGRSSLPPSVPTPRRENLCRGCGKTIRVGRSHCGQCAISGATERFVGAARLGRLVSNTPEARVKQANTQRQHAKARASWTVSSQPAWLTSEVYSQKIQPLLAGVSNSAIRAQIRVSRWYAGYIRRGHFPHPRHWQALAQLVGVSGQQTE